MGDGGLNRQGGAVRGKPKPSRASRPSSPMGRFRCFIHQLLSGRQAGRLSLSTHHGTRPERMSISSALRFFSLLHLLNVANCSKNYGDHGHHGDHRKHLRDKGISITLGRPITCEKRSCWAHNPEVVGSNPTPATNCHERTCDNASPFFFASIWPGVPLP